MTRKRGAEVEESTLEHSSMQLNLISCSYLLELGLFVICGGRVASLIHGCRPFQDMLLLLCHLNLGDANSE